MSRAGQRRGLSRGESVAILGLAVTYFLLGRGAVWLEPTDHAGLVPSIAWSYALIPVFTLACLVWRRRLDPGAWLIATLEIMALKFAVTAGIMIAIWSFAPASPAEAGFRYLAVASPGTPATDGVDGPVGPPPSGDGRLDVLATDRSGRPIPGVLVAIEGGLEDLRWPAPTDEVVLRNDGSGFEPRLRVLHARQPVRVVSVDGRLHSLRGTDRFGRMVVNLPALPIRGAVPRRVGHARGLATIRCGVHGGSTESGSLLLVVGSPFVAHADAGGRVVFEGVPSGRELLVLAVTPDARLVSRTRVTLVPNGAEAITLALGAPGRD